MKDIKLMYIHIKWQLSSSRRSVGYGSTEAIMDMAQSTQVVFLIQKIHQYNNPTIRLNTAQMTLAVL